MSRRAAVIARIYAALRETGATDDAAKRVLLELGVPAFDLAEALR